MKKNSETACGLVSLLLLGFLVAYVMLHIQAWTGSINAGLVNAAACLPWK